MNRFSIVRYLVAIGVSVALSGAFSGGLTGCVAQGTGPDDLSQTDTEPRHAELVGVEGDNAAVVAHPQEANLSISGTTPLGGKVAGPQPEPWHGADGDPNGGPQPEPWKPHKFAPDSNDPAPK